MCPRIASLWTSSFLSRYRKTLLITSVRRHFPLLIVSYDHDHFMSRWKVALNTWSITLTHFCVRESPCCDRYALLWVRHSYHFLVFFPLLVSYFTLLMYLLSDTSYSSARESTQKFPTSSILIDVSSTTQTPKSSKMIRTSSPTQFQFFHHSFQVRITFTS